MWLPATPPSMYSSSKPLRPPRPIVPLQHASFRSEEHTEPPEDGGVELPLAKRLRPEEAGVVKTEPASHIMLEHHTSPGQLGRIMGLLPLPTGVLLWQRDEQRNTRETLLTNMMEVAVWQEPLRQFFTELKSTASSALLSAAQTPFLRHAALSHFQQLIHNVWQPALLLPTVEPTPDEEAKTCSSAARNARILFSKLLYPTVYSGNILRASLLQLRRLLLNAHKNNAILSLSKLGCCEPVPFTPVTDFEDVMDEAYYKADDEIHSTSLRSTSPFLQTQLLLQRRHTAQQSSAGFLLLSELAKEVPPEAPDYRLGIRVEARAAIWRQRAGGNVPSRRGGRARKTALLPLQIRRPAVDQLHGSGEEEEKTGMAKSLIETRRISWNRLDPRSPSPLVVPTLAVSPKQDQPVLLGICRFPGKFLQQHSFAFLAPPPLPVVGGLYDTAPPLVDLLWV